MPNKTLLQIVQNVLISMESLNVNSIDDNEESQAVAEIAEQTYYELLGSADWPHLVKATKLESLSDSTKPNYLEIPFTVNEIQTVMYNGTELTFLEPVEFLKMVTNRDETLDNVQEVDGINGVQFKVYNDEDPKYFTVLESKYIVADAYDSDVSSTLTSDSSSIIASQTPEWSSTDSFVPDLTDKMFPVYLSMVKRAAFLYLRREPSMHDERASIAGLGRLLRSTDKLKNKKSVKDYGRKK